MSGQNITTPTKGGPRPAPAEGALSSESPGARLQEEALGLKGDCSSSSWLSVDWEGYLSTDGTQSESSEHCKIWGSLLPQRRPSAKPPGADSKSGGPAQQLGVQGSSWR